MNTLEEKIENAVNWIDELLDTQYKQATSRLGNIHDGFCCLGVCNYVNDLYEADKSTLYLSFKKVGLISASGQFTIPIETKDDIAIMSLVSLNDIHNWTFKQIGELIRDYPQYIFRPKVAGGIIEHYSKH